MGEGKGKGGRWRGGVAEVDGGGRKEGRAMGSRWWRDGEGRNRKDEGKAEVGRWWREDAGEEQRR